MKKILFILLVVLFSSACTQQRKCAINVIPKPMEYTLSNEIFKFDNNSKLAIDAPEECKERLTEYLEAVIPVVSNDNAKRNYLRLQLCDSIPEITSDEGYKINCDKKGVTIEATGEAGLFYGIQTILQCIDNEGGVPLGTIIDEPRFAYRGVMLDVSRHFFDKEFVLKQIDAISRYKMNRLHLHLTDAAGWRIEIKKYPRLTQFAAWREYALWKDWWNKGRKYVEEGANNANGGYFTQDDIREIVEYAAERHITIIPEIEMPAHSEEVLTAYPQLSCTHEPYKQADFCVGNEKTFEFLENVLSEVIELFPSEYIHIGGDEATKESWPKCPLCQKRMKEQGLKNVEELQSYFIHRIERFVNSKGRQIIGWDEILDGGLAPNATVMSWRGTEGGLAAVASGHKAIMSPGTFCYLDQYQDAPHTQPEAIGGYLPLEKVYSYEPVPASLSCDEAKLVYGIQGNLWAEYIPTPEHLECMMYPRILAIAEIGWSAQQTKDYKNFRERALAAVDYLRNKGYNPFNLANETGNRPKAQQESNHLARGKRVIYSPDAPYFEGYAAGGDSALVDGRHGAWNNNDGVWQGFTKNGIDVVIDLGKRENIKHVGADFMQICNPWIFMPCEVTISVSDDNINFSELTNIKHKVVEDDELTFMNFGWTGEAVTRYVRYRAKCDRVGGWLFTDEIVVE